MVFELVCLSGDIKCEYAVCQCYLYILQYFVGVFFHDSCKVVVSLDNCFRGAVKAVSFVKYCTASSQGCTHFWEGCHVTYSFNVFLSGLMNIRVPCIWMLFSWMEFFENELGISSLNSCHHFPQSLCSSGAVTATVTSSCCLKYLQVFICSFNKTFPICRGYPLSQEING